MVVAPKLPENPHLLIDGDILAYRAAAASEKTLYCVTAQPNGGKDAYDDVVFYFNNASDANDKVYELSEWYRGTEAGPALAPECIINRWSRKDVKDENFTYMLVEQLYDVLLEQFPEHTSTTYISGERNFRDFVWKTKKYKGNRNVERPKNLPQALDRLVHNHLAIKAEGEADDAIISEHYKYNPMHRSIICSNDKDLDQASGWHFDFVKKELYFVTQRDADLFLFQQILSGDATDNVPGLPGWGPATARKWLAGADSTQSCLARVKEAYLEATPEYFEEQAELIYIRRDGRSFKEYFNA